MNEASRGSSGLARRPDGLGAGTWILVFALTRYASVASIVAALSMPLWSWLIGYPWPVTVFAGIAAVGVIVLHRANIKRLLHGEESRFTRKRRGGATGANPAAPPR